MISRPKNLQLRRQNTEEINDYATKKKYNHTEKIQRGFI